MKRLYLLLLLALMSCIRNDIPYPAVTAGIADMQVEGAKSVRIDAAAREVVVVLEEASDIRSVRVTSVTFTDSRVKASEELVGVRDLSSPVVVTLSVYSECQWTIRAEQPVERYFTVAGQIGNSVIDVANRRVLVKYPEGKSLKSLTVTSMKLGPAGISTCFPEASELHDFSEPCTVLVSYRDVEELWLVSVEPVEQSVTMGSVDAWTRVAWLQASGSGSGDCGFKIRRKGDADWSDVGDVRLDNGYFSAAADALEPLTRYEVYAFSGTDRTEAVEFETEAELQLPNAGFETFSNASIIRSTTLHLPIPPCGPSGGGAATRVPPLSGPAMPSLCLTFLPELRGRPL